MRYSPRIAALVFMMAAISAEAQEGLLPRDQLIDDTRQLADIIENVHPSPYFNGGGKMSSHRRLHRILNSIPDKGMTAESFFGLLAPFVGAVGDAHTRLHFPV